MTLIDTIAADSASLGENRDCAVRAVTAATNLPYAYIHAVFSRCGRIRTKGTPFIITGKVLDKLGVTIEPITTDCKTIRTLGRSLPKEGIFLVRTRRHILACVNGKVIDWTDGRLHRIKEIYRVTL